MSRYFLPLALLVSLLVSLAAAQNITFSQVASSTAFPGREYAACLQTPASVGSTPTLYFFGGFNVTLTNTSTNIATSGNTYTDGYYNDAWSSTNFGATWNLLTANAAFVPQAWNGAVRTSSGTIVYIGGGGDSNSGENNQVYTSNDGISFTATTAGPWAPRENAGIAGMPGTNNILVALGNTNNAQSVDDIWYSQNGGSSWTQTCHYTSCPFVNSVDSTRIPGQVHGPAAVGTTTGYWLLIGGYGNDPVTNATTWVTNQVAVSRDGFATWSTYTAPWSPRAQMRAVGDNDGFVYAYGGVYNLPVSGSGTAYPNVASQVYYGYYQDMWFTTSPQSGNWKQLTVTGFGGTGVYPGTPYPGSNPNSATLPSTFYTNGAVFNPCLAFGYSSSGAKQLVVYTGLYAGYRQNMIAGQAVLYPGVYVGTLAGLPTTSGATMASVSAISVLAATLMAIIAHML